MKSTECGSLDRNTALSYLSISLKEWGAGCSISIIGIGTIVLHGNWLARSFFVRLNQILFITLCNRLRLLAPL